MAAKIDECFAQRKLKQFVKYPVVTDLNQNLDMISGVLEMLADREHPLSKTLLKESPGMTHEQIVTYIAGIRARAGQQAGLFSKNTIIFFLAAVLVAVAAFFLYRKFATKSIAAVVQP